MDQVDWNAELVQGDLEKAVQQLKREPGKGLFVGGVTLPLALADLGLIDEYEFVVQPILAGHGADVARRPERAARVEARGAPGVRVGGGGSALPAQSSHGLKVGGRALVGLTRVADDGRRRIGIGAAARPIPA